jgi:putative ABC transport system ATP-binding protein
MAATEPLRSIEVSERPVVRIEAVSKSYDLAGVPVLALKSVSLAIRPRRFSMIVGPSGSGKSTLLNLIGCIDSPTSGRIEIAGEAIAEKSDDVLSEFRAREIGFVFQNFNLISVLSAYENIEYPLILAGLGSAERRHKTLEMLESVGLAGHASHRPNQLSGGQKQRVAIGRALVKGPTLVLADEPTANLDSKTGADILELMHRMQSEHGATFIFSTHDPQLISRADEVFVIRDGELQGHRVINA